MGLKESHLTADPTRPQTYARRILVVVTGMSPQVVTETVYALAVATEPAWAPTEIRLVTTREGAQVAERHLLQGGEGGDEGWFHQLRQDYQLPAIDFNAQSIHTLEREGAGPMDDIQTPADNTAAADAITQLLCELTRDDESALHVSIAGGRKTMGFYLGYALSLYGRAQDRLSHVLVNPPYESNPKFFYPTPTKRMIETRAGDLVDARDARVGLAEIPFVRLREGLPKDLLEGKIRFHDAVEAAQRALGPLELVIDLPAKRLRAGDKTVVLSPLHLAFLAWLARRHKDGQDGVECPTQDVPEASHAREFLTEYRSIIGQMGDDERTTKRLREEKGMTREFFSQTKSKLHRTLKEKLGHRRATPYLVSRYRSHSRWLYGLEIDHNAIHFKELAQ